MTDGLSGIEESIHSVYPNAQFQQCCVHVSRNIAHKVRVRDRKERGFQIGLPSEFKEEALDHIDFMIRNGKAVSKSRQFTLESCPINLL